MMMQGAGTAVGLMAVLGSVKGRTRANVANIAIPVATRARATARAVAVEAEAAAAEVDYAASNVSVFPVEACELVGGDACQAHMYPEAKLALQASPSSSPPALAEEVDRDYLAYDEPNTVFPDEACDDLGGEFCQAT